MKSTSKKKVLYAMAVATCLSGGCVQTPTDSGGQLGKNVTNPPSAPTISSVSDGDGSATVSWGNVSGATSYNLYWGTGSTVDKTSGTEVIGVTSPCRIMGFVNGTQYAFAVSAVNSAGESGLSGVLTATPQESVAWVDSMTDADGNIYHAVQIGTQVWTVENLKTTKYRDGSPIPLVTDNNVWGGLTTPACCYYNNDSIVNKAIYGALYNSFAVNTGKLAPAGWHVPTDTEWTILLDYLGGVNEAGAKLKEAGTAHWPSPNPAATNESKFTALPGGCRSYNGPFYSIGDYGCWWSESSGDAGSSWYRLMDYGSAMVNRIDYSDRFGLSVRCLRD